MYLEGELQESYGRSGAGVAAPSKARTELLRRALSGRVLGKPLPSKVFVLATSKAMSGHNHLVAALAANPRTSRRLGLQATTKKS